MFQTPKCILANSNEEQYSNENASELKIPYLQLLNKFSYDNLETLKNVFKTKNPDERLNKQQFSDAMESIFEDDEGCVEKSITLFEEITNKNKNSTKISWSEFLDFLLTNLNKETSKRNVALIFSDTTPASHVKNESIVKIVLIETEKYFCYAMVSKHGRVGLYDGNLNFLTSYHLIMTREDINRKEEERRKRNRWITDVIFCLDILMLIATNSARSVVIYEASGLKHVPMWLILSAPNIIECFCYRSISSGSSALFMGANNGTLLSFNFLQPKIGPLRKKYSDKISLFYWDELHNEKDFCVFKNHGLIHKDSARSMKYFHDNGTIVICSRDADNSLVIKNLFHKNKPYIFKMKRGCNCFDLSRILKILVTGSDDGVIRIWNPIITSKPTAVLKGHRSGVVDVKIMERQKAFLSCSRDGHLKLWDIANEKSIQNLIINFPAFSIFGKQIEWGIESIYPGPKRFDNKAENGDDLEVWERSEVLVCCCTHIARVKLVFEDKTTESSFESQILPPPPLQNSVLVPKCWKTNDHIDFKKLDHDQVPVATIQSDSGEIKIDPKVLEQRLLDYKFILDKDLVAEYGTKSDVNFKIGNLENKKRLMQQNVARGAPYLALDLYEVENIRLTPGLPVPNKRTKSLVEKVEKILEDASARDIIFSEPSSSRSTPRSSRSSIVEFEY